MLSDCRHAKGFRLIIWIFSIIDSYDFYWNRILLLEGTIVTLLSKGTRENSVSILSVREWLVHVTVEGVFPLPTILSVSAPIIGMVFIVSWVRDFSNKRKWYNINEKWKKFSIHNRHCIFVIISFVDEEVFPQRVLWSSHPTVAVWPATAPTLPIGLTMIQHTH